MDSPTGDMMMQFQDPRIPETYLEPAPGLAVGQIVSYGPVPVPVLPPMSGARFAAEWMGRMYGRSGTCQPFQVTDTVAAPVPRDAGRFALSQVRGASGGCVFFTCGRPNGQTVDGAAFVTTVQSVYMGRAIWTAVHLWHVLVDPGWAQHGFALARQIAASVQVNPQVVAALNARTAAASGPTPGAGDGSQAMVDALNRSAKNKFDAMHEQNQTMDQIIGDTQTLTNPETGAQVQAPYNSGNQQCQNGGHGRGRQHLWAVPVRDRAAALARGGPHLAA